MYKYPNRDHYLNSLGKASDVGRSNRRVRLDAYAGHEQYYPQSQYLGQQFYQPGQHLDQPVEVVGNPNPFFLTKSKKDGIRRVVPYNPNLPQKPNQKSYHGPVLGPNGKVWYVSDKNKGMVRPAYNQAENTMVVNYGQKIAKANARPQAGPKPHPYPGQAHANRPAQGRQGRQGKPGKPGKPQKPRPLPITKSPYGVLEGTNKLIEALVALKKKASVPGSNVKDPEKFDGAPYYFDTLQKGLQNFVRDFHNKASFFKDRNPDAKLGQTIEHIAESGDGMLFYADGWHDLTTEKKIQYSISVLAKLRKNIIAAIRGKDKFRSAVDRRKAAIENIAKAARVDGVEGKDSKEAMIRVVKEAAEKVIDDGELHMVWSPDVSKRIPVQIVLMMMEEHGLERDASWTTFSAHAAGMHKPELWKTIMKHEAVFKKAVKKAAHIMYNRAKAAEKGHEGHAHGSARVEEIIEGKFPSAKESRPPPSSMPGGAKPAPNLFSMYRQSRYDP